MFELSPKQFAEIWAECEENMWKEVRQNCGKGENVNKSDAEKAFNDLMQVWPSEIVKRSCASLRMNRILLCNPDGSTEEVTIQKPTTSGDLSRKGYNGPNRIEVEFINTSDMLDPIAVPDDAPAKPFGEACAEVWRDVKGYVGGKTLDPSVKEQVSGEVDTMIERHEGAGKRSFPSKALG